MSRYSLFLAVSFIFSIGHSAFAQRYTNPKADAQAATGWKRTGTNVRLTTASDLVIGNRFFGRGGGASLPTYADSLNTTTGFGFRSGQPTVSLGGSLLMEFNSNSRIKLSDVNGTCGFYANSTGTAYLTFTLSGSGPNHIDLANSNTTPILTTAGDSTNIDFQITPKGAGSVIIAADIDPEADGTRDLGTQTTAQWANVWADLVNGADFSLKNGNRILESEKYYGYHRPGIAFGNKGFRVGRVTKKMPEEAKPYFVATDKYVEFMGYRFYEKDFEKLIDNGYGERAKPEPSFIKKTLKYLLYAIPGVIAGIAL